MQKFIISFLLSFSLYNCTTTKSRFASESSDVIGGVYVQKIQTPQLYKKASFLTETVTYAPIAGGIAWGATEGKDIKINDNGKEKPIGAFVGVLAGGWVGYMASYLVKEYRPQNKILKVDESNYAKWLSKNKNLKDNYVGVEANGYETITFLPKEGYKKFTVSNAYELDLYKKAYGNVGEDGLIDRSLGNANTEILLMRLYDFTTTDFNKSRVGKKYILSTPDYFTFLDRTSKIKVLKSEEIAQEASSRVMSIAGALAFRKDFSDKAELQNLIFERLYKTLGKTELKQFLESYINVKNIKEGIKYYVSLSKTISEFNTAVYNFPQLGVTSQNPPLNFEAALDYDVWIQNTVGTYLDKSTTESIRSTFQKEFLQSKFQLAISSTQELKALNSKITASSWVLEGIGISFQHKIYDEMEHIAAVERLASSREEFGDAALFAFAKVYPTDKEIQRLLPELEQLTQKYIKVEEDDIWQAIGNHTIGDDMVSSFFESSKIGGQYNIFVWGLLSNSLDYPVKIDLTSTLNYSNTTGISLFKSTTQKTWNESYQTEVPANGKTAFVVVYKDFRVGGTIGSGLMSAGSVSEVNKSNPYTVRFKYFNGDISNEKRRQQRDFIQKLIKKGNIQVNDSEEAKSQREQERITDRIQRDKEKETEKKELEIEETNKRTEKQEIKVKECIKEVNSELTKITNEDSGWFTKLDCPCTYYDDPSFFGYSLTIKENSRNEWTYVINGMFSNTESSVFVSKGDALRGVCEKWYKSQK